MAGGSEAATGRLAVLQGQLTANPSSAGAPRAPTAVICGGIVLDIQASASDHILRRGGSVPGTVRQVPGGVARNIADAASQLLQDPIPAPLLVSVVGADAAGQTLLDNLRKLRLDLTYVRQLPDMPTASVCLMLDRTGEVACCVADVTGPEQHLTPSLLTHLLPPSLHTASATSHTHSTQLHTPDHTHSHHTATHHHPHSIQPHTAHIAHTPSQSATPHHHVQPHARQTQRAHIPSTHGSSHGQHTGGISRCQPLLVLDTNLSEDAIVCACREALGRGVSVVLEPVSGPKAVRAVTSLCAIDWITPNAAELLAMADEFCRQHHRPSCTQQPQQPKHSPQNTSQSYPITQESQCIRHVSGQGPSEAVVGLLQPLLPAAALLLSAGTKNIVLTLGESGAALITRATQSTASTQHPGTTQQGTSTSQGACITRATQTTANSTTDTIASTQQQQGTTQPGTSTSQGNQDSSTQQCVSLRIVHMPALPCRVVSTNGAGDTLVGGLVAGVLRGRTDREAVALGIAAARATVQSEANVCPQLSWEGLQGDVRTILSQACEFETSVVLQ